MLVGGILALSLSQMYVQKGPNELVHPFSREKLPSVNQTLQSETQRRFVRSKLRPGSLFRQVNLFGCLGYSLSFLY